VSNPRPQAKTWSIDWIAETLRDHFNWLVNEHKRVTHGAFQLTETGYEKIGLLGQDVVKFGNELIHMSKSLSPANIQPPPKEEPVPLFEQPKPETHNIIGGCRRDPIDDLHAMSTDAYSRLETLTEALLTDLVECAKQRDGIGRLLSVAAEVLAIMHKHTDLAKMLGVEIPSDEIIPPPPRDWVEPTA